MRGSSRIIAALLAVGLVGSVSALGTELDRFEIRTDEASKEVQVTLYADQRANYTTENQGNQFAVILKDTKLSKEQLENGFPVVIDNENKFIGRAVPTGEGQVKIILPNLPADKYAVSVLQKKPDGSSMDPVTKLKPRTAIIQESSQFEAIATPLAKTVPVVQQTPPSPSHPALKADAAPPKHNGGLRLSPPPSSTKGTHQQSIIVNPYVQPQKAAASPPPRPRSTAPVRQAYTPPPYYPGYTHPPIQQEPINTLSLADSTPSGGPETEATDPLWYLHSLPPLDSTDLSSEGLVGGMLPKADLAPAESLPQIQVSPSSGIITELKQTFQQLPWWVYLIAGLFFTGIGLFTLVGALSLLWLMITQSRQKLPLAAPVPAPTKTPPQEVLNESTSRATTGHPLQFQDTSRVNGADYLVHSPSNVKEAVHNTTLLKFPSNPKHRVGSRNKPLPRRRVGSRS